MARDATARQYDVDADSVVLDKKEGTITFRTKKGKSFDLDKLHESIKSTRLGDSTGMVLHVLQVTVAGELVMVEKDLMLKVPGSEQLFKLWHDPDVKPDAGNKYPYERLQEAFKRGETKVTVTGRVDGWKGNLTQFSKELPAKPRTLMVKEVQPVKP